jgi:hypothetical protein
MYPEVIRAFERNLEKTTRIVERPDTKRARAMAKDKATFDRNLSTWCQVQAFDRTVEFIAKQRHTTDLNVLRAVVRRSGLLDHCHLH